MNKKFAKNSEHFVKMVEARCPMLEKTHACHKTCGKDVECHAKCPKPWAPFVKACQEFPAIKACHAKCEGAECEKCRKFDMEWMNEKLAKTPELVVKMAEAKCPMIEEAHACHKVCRP